MREDGRFLGSGYCDARHPESGRCPWGSGRSSETIAVAVRQALEGHGCTVIHTVCGGNRLSDPVSAGPGCEVRGMPSVSESEIGFASVGLDYGVIVLAGTGSFVHSRGADGHVFHYDAFGPIIGDDGSGHHIGMLALRAVARAPRHPRHATTLTAAVKAAVGTWRGSYPQSLMGLFSAGLPDRGEIASLAVLVNAHAERGDRIARQIIEQAADAISDTIADLVDRMGIAGQVWPLIAMGSVATRSRLYWDRVQRRIREVAPRVYPVLPTLSPVTIMALVALRRLGAADPESLRRNLLTTAEPAQVRMEAVIQGELQT